MACLFQNILLKLTHRFSQYIHYAHNYL